MDAKQKKLVIDRLIYAAEQRTALRLYLEGKVGKDYLSKFGIELKMPSGIQ